MKAMILAAGRGTRLQPLTNNIPKALIKIGEYTLLELIIMYLKKYGIEDIIINVSHFAGQIIEYLEMKKNFNVNIILSDESDGLLETGGGLKKAGWFFNSEENMLLISGDVLTNLKLDEMIHYHHKNRNLITLAVKDRETSRSLLFDDNLILTGWKDNRTGEKKLIRNNPVRFQYGFSTVHIINTSVFNLFPDAKKFPIMDFYLTIGKETEIYGFEHNKDIWIEFGRYERLSGIMNSENLKEVIQFIKSW
jgi:N-acetyl-alpha-D-muramate 1-phosphate uridylyltransferase